MKRGRPTKQEAAARKTAREAAEMEASKRQLPPLRFRLNLECDNAAFEGENMQHEIARCLRAVADRVERGEDCGLYRNIHDINGNPVGTFALKPSDQI